MVDLAFQLAMTMIHLPFSSRYTEIAPKQLGHWIVNCQLVALTNLSITQQYTILAHQSMSNPVTQILSQTKQLTRTTPIQTFNMNNPMTRRLTNSYTMHQTKQRSPVHHLHLTKISLWIKALTHNRKQHLTLMQPKNSTKSLQEIYIRLSSFNGCEESNCDWPRETLRGEWIPWLLIKRFGTDSLKLSYLEP